MLRSARRILKPTGKMAYWVIEITPGLSAADYQLAMEGEANSAMPQHAPTGDLLEFAGFGQVEARDVTKEYLDVAAAWLVAASSLEAPLRRALGDDVYENRVNVRQQGIDMTAKGLHRRMFYTARSAISSSR